MNIDYEGIAKKHNVSVEVVKEVERNIFDGVRHFMLNEPGRRILLHGFASFSVSFKRINYLIRAEIKKYRESSDPEYKKKVREHIYSLLQIRRRAINSMPLRKRWKKLVVST